MVHHDPVEARMILNEDNIAKVAGFIRRGVPFKAACNIAGIHSAKIYDWMKQGELDHSMGSDSRYSQFFLAVKEAEGNLEERLVSKWVNSLEKKEDGWKGIKEFLEKRFKDEWGKAPTEINAHVLDLRKAPEFTELVRMIMATLPPEKQIELSELLAHED